MTAPENIDEIVAHFIALRDRLEAEDKAHKEKTEAAREYKKQLEAKLLAKLNDIGGESVKTANGTVYRTTRRSASIADGASFRRFVIGGNHFDLVDWRANAVAIDDFIKENDAPPPGVNYSTAYTVGVRRA